MTRLLSLLLALSLGGLAHAQPVPPVPAPAPVLPSPVSAKVDVSVQVIRATTGAPAIDARLIGLKDTLARLPFQSFQLIDDQDFRLTDGMAVEMPLGDERTLRLRLASHNSTEAKVEVRYARAGADAVETLVTITRDRGFLSVLKGGASGALLLKIDVRY